MTVKKIILRYLELNLGTHIANHIFETVVPNFGKNIYGVLHTPGTYSRAWRELREKGELTKYGYSVIEVEANSKEKHFVVRRLSEVHRNSKRSSEQAGDNNSANRVEETSFT